MNLHKKLTTALSLGCGMFYGGSVAALSLLSRPRDMMWYVEESLLMYHSFSRRRGVPEKNVYEVLGCKEAVADIALGNLQNGGTWFSAASSFAIDIISLCLICRLLKPKMVFEIGTLTGYTSFHFALNTPEDAKIFTLDLPKSVGIMPELKTDVADDAGIRRHALAPRYCFERSPVADKIETLFSDSATFDYSPFHGKVDFFFVDGAHSYEYVRSDTLNAIKCCHPGSVIAWHDFHRMVVGGVAKYVREFSREHEIYAAPGGSLAYMVVK